MEHIEIARAFGFKAPSSAALRSIHPYAPVYRLSDSKGQWILKRTSTPLASAQAIARWITALADQGIPVVYPASAFGENPRHFQADSAGEAEVWVVYPFIDGIGYNRLPQQIRAAGDLLGQIHLIGMESDFGLEVQAKVVTVDQAEIKQDIATISRHVSQVFPAAADKAIQILTERCDRYFQSCLPRIEALDLPLTNGSFDYKISNLIYSTDQSPVLIDPDQGARIPRAYDLAIAAVLFHNDGVADSVLTQAEWSAFLAGYFRHSQLTTTEKEHWEDILLCAWIDEGVWLMADHEAGWRDPIESQMLLSLLTMPLETFDLSPNQGQVSVTLPID